MILHRLCDADQIRRLAEAILYPLWDAGLTVGHAVRTPDECLAAADERLDVAASLLDVRLVAGDEGAFEETRGRLVSLVRRDPVGFVTRLREDAERRRARFGSATDLLEPELKDGAGGLRDVHAVRWAALGVLGEASFQALERAGTLRPREREALEAAEEFLTRVRSALHLETGRATDRLLLEQQPQVAAALGFDDEPRWPAVDGLMRATFEHARQVEHVSAAVCERLLADRTADPVEVEPGPEGVLRVFADAAERDTGIAGPVLEAAESLDWPEGGPWSPSMREQFLRILRAGEGGRRALSTLDRVDLLGRLLPEWRAVRCRPQRDPYHRYTVDVHLLQTLAATGRLLAGDTGDDPIAAEAVSAIRDRDGLLLGALLHDVGKTGERRHVPVGIEMASSALARMGVPERTRDLALFLVAHHLLLSDTATRRDLQEEELVVDVAVIVGETERLAALYLLTGADAEATGPHAWTPWRATLVRELVGRVQRILDRGDVEEGTADRLARATAEVRAALANQTPKDVERFLERVPSGYLLSVPADTAAAHFPLVMPRTGALDVRTLARPGTREGTYSLTVVAADRPGLLSWIAGSLSLAGLSILSAQVFTTEDGLAVDLFDVVGVFEGDVVEERWREFRSTLRHVLQGRVALEHRVAEKRKSYPPPRGGIPVEVTADNQASDFFTVIEVAAPDRIGLLFDITRTLAELQLDVHLAKVATYGERVIDAFYVRDVLGRKVDDPDQVREIRGAISHRVTS